MTRSKKSGAPSVRLLRVAENIRHALADILRREDIDDADLAGVSVTVSEVRVSPDLRNATVFVSPLGGQDEAVVVKALNRHSGYIRGHLAKRVELKYLPRLKFTADESYDEAGRIEALLRSDKVRRDIATPDEGDDGAA